MIYVKISDGNLDMIHHMPFDPVHGLGIDEETLLLSGILIETLPIPDVIEGKISELKYSQDKGLFYEYYDVPKTQEQLQNERFASIETDLANASYALMMGGLI